MIQMIISFISFIILLFVFTSCTIFQKHKDYSTFMNIGEFKDSIIKVTVYKDTVNYSNLDDTIAYILAFEIIDDEYSILYRCDALLEPIPGIYDEIDSIRIILYLGINEFNLNRELCFKELKNSEILSGKLVLTKSQILEEIKNNRKITNFHFENVKITFEIMFYYVRNKRGYYGKKNASFRNFDELYFYTHDLHLPKIFEFKFTSYEKLVD